MIRRWTPEEDELLMECYNTSARPREIAECLERSLTAVYERRRTLVRNGRDRTAECARNRQSAQTANGHGCIWTTAETEIIQRTMDLPVAEVAAQVGRSIFSVQARRRVVRGVA